MENRNNALHYKMYKSGKSIVFAGLATTAALAGLTLANANATTVHAATNEPATEKVASPAANTSATQQEIASQEEVVNSVSADVANQEKIVSKNKANLDTASALNSGVSAVSVAQSAYDKANSDYYQASAAVGSAAKASQDAKAAMDNAQDWKNYFDNGGQDKYNDIQSQIASEQKKLDLANAQSAATSASAASALENANSASDALKADPSNQDLKTAYDKAMLDLSTANGNDANVKQVINSATSIIQSLKNKLAGKEALVGTTKPVNFIYGQQEIAKLPELTAAFNKAHQAYLDAVNARNEAGDIANAKYEALQNVKISNNLMTPDMQAYKDLSQNAYTAKQELPNLKSNSKVTKVSDAQKAVTADEGVLEKAQNAQASAQKHYDNVLAIQAELEQKLADAKKTDPNDTLGMVSSAQGALDNWKANDVDPAKSSLDKANTNLTNAENGLKWRKDQLSKAQNDPEYIKIEAQIQKDQAFIDSWNQLQSNLKEQSSILTTLATLQGSYDNSVKVLKAMQDKLAREEAKLAAMKGETTPSEKPGDNEGNKPGNDDQQQPGDNQGNDDQNQGNGSSVNGGSAATNNGAANGSTSTTVNGNHASAVAGNAVANKVSFATTTGKYAAATNVEAAKKDSEALPQTGNENSAAVVALGAVSAMFGLGLAAKKREF